MTTRWSGAAIGLATVASLALVFGACGDDDDDGGAGPGTGAADELVIAPFGFRIEIESAELPADASATAPSVTFRVTEGEGAGTPVDDLLQRIQNSPTGGALPTGHPYVNAPTFTLARLDPRAAGGPPDEYASYYLNLQSAAAPAGTQATGVGIPRDGTGLESLGAGRYRYTFHRGTPLAPAVLAENPSQEQRARTHTVGVYTGQVPTPGAAEQPASATFNFVPAGGTPELHQLVAANACNTCHAPAVRAHARRLGVQLCLTCHTPQTTDPQTGNSVEFAEMVHKIHYGGGRALGAADVNPLVSAAARPSNLPETAPWPPAPAGGPQPYTIIGFGGAAFVFDKSFINDVRSCALCHQGEDADRHLTFATEQSCQTCHSNVKFDGSAPRFCDTQAADGGDCGHPSLVPAGASCSTCHTPDLIQSSHVTRFALAEQYRYEIQDVTVDAERRPTVRFRVLDTRTNQPRNLDTDPSYRQPGSSLSARFTWPPSEYTNDGSGNATFPGQPVAVAGIAAGARARSIPTDPTSPLNMTDVPGQPNTYALTSTVPVPAGVASISAHLEGHPVLQGENVPVVNAIRTVGLDGAPAEQRRQVVSVESCNSCHGVVSAHGENRNGSIETCVVCHNPKATDAGRRGAAVAGESTIDFKVMIHQIHAADIKQNPVTIYGFAPPPVSRTPHVFPGVVPHNIGNCNLCHVNQSWRLPLADEVLDTVVNTGARATLANQADDVAIGAMRAVCTSCHDNVQFTQAPPPAAPLPACNTFAQVNGTEPEEFCLHSAGNVADSTCAACHGTGQSDDIAQKHPIR